MRHKQIPTSKIPNATPTIFLPLSGGGVRRGWFSNCSLIIVRSAILYGGLVYGFWNLLNAYVPEDSNCHYLMDKQIAGYFPSWEARFDSVNGVIRTSQGCLDLLSWYIDLETRYDVSLSRILGLRYRYQQRSDYGEQIARHYFEPFFQLRNNLRWFFSINPNYYKGVNELGMGAFWGRNYLNFLEILFFAEGFDRNFSLQNTAAGPGKVIYDGLGYPFKLRPKFTKNWHGGRVHVDIELGNRYRLVSTDEPATYIEEGLQRSVDARFWQAAGKFQFAVNMHVKQKEISIDSATFTPYNHESFEIIAEPVLAYSVNDRLKPLLYLTYNGKTADDNTGHYHRDVFAYLIELEYRPGGNFIWHLANQRQFYFRNDDYHFQEMRYNVGLEYRFNNVWFYLVEAMEGDFPTPKYMHNHTYVQLMLLF